MRPLLESKNTFSQVKYIHRAVSNDIFARVYAENVSKIIASVTNIVKALNGCLAKRASNPIAGPEILLRYNQEAVKMKESTLGTI